VACEREARSRRLASAGAWHEVQPLATKYVTSHSQHAMQSDGGFCVWLRGLQLATSTLGERRLTSDERRRVGEQLRAWLDSSSRTTWTIER